MLKLITQNCRIAERAARVLVLCLAVLLFSACSRRESIHLPVIEDYDTSVVAVERKNLKLGVVAGPYGDMFQETIEPLLVQMGYTIELVYYDNYSDPNFALANHEVDLNMMQHYKHLSGFKFEHDVDISAITEVPTISMGIFSSKYNSLDELEEGVYISIPLDSTNRSRALMALEAAGIIKIDPSVDKSKATEYNIIQNPYYIKVAPLDAQNLVGSLEYFELSVITDNFALSGDLTPSEALYSEVLGEGYMTVIAVRTEDLGELFVRDLIRVIDSDEYKNAIMKNGGKYSGFQRPSYFFN